MMWCCSGGGRLRFLLGLPLFLVICFSGVAEAEPYLAVRYGYKCSKCHVNPTGGGMRNAFGNIMTQTVLPEWTVSADDLRNFVRLGESTTAILGEDPELSAEAGAAPTKQTPDSTFYPGRLSRRLAVGADFRFNNRSTWSDGSSTNTVDITEGNLYAHFDLLGDVLGLYLDETVAPGGASSREVYALLRGPWESYLKAGRMMLPWGFRLQDDSAFIRELTGFNYGVQDLGVEVGMEPGPFSLSLAVSNGTGGSSDNNKDKQVTGVASFIQRYYRIGGQAGWNNTPSVKSVAVGGFGGVNLGRFTLLGEIDLMVDELKSIPGEPLAHKLILYGAANYQLTRGTNLKFTYDWVDPNTSDSHDRVARVSTGVELFVTQFVQLRSFYRFRDMPGDDMSLLDFEIHLFF